MQLALPLMNGARALGRWHAVQCRVIGGPVKKSATLIGEPIKSTGKPALRITRVGWDCELLVQGYRVLGLP